ncbi:MAG: caspase family protein [Melioribacteraceae bacterium]|nr:caspase family protein [Melioribacteraceae bacterium]
MDTKKNIILILMFAGFQLINANQFKGICVGINDYPGTYNDLNYCVNDAQEIRSGLINHREWHSDQLELITNSSATEANIKSKISNLPSVNGKNTSIFSFSGHGGTSGLYSYSETSLSPSELQSAFGSSYNQYACFIDACYSGVFPSGMSKGVISSACSSNELSYENPYLQNGVYSYYIIQGLGSSSADGSDNLLSAEELHVYAAPLVTNYQSNMHPQIDDNYSGSLRLSIISLTSVSITGSYTIYNEGSYQYLAKPTDGKYPLSYQWEKKMDGDLVEKTEKGGGIKAPPSGSWISIGTNSDILTLSPPNNGDWRNFYLRCKVTDGDGVSKYSSSMYITVTNTTPPTQKINSKDEEEIKISLSSEQIVPESYGLEQNYPNPFNPTTKISYQLPESGFVNLKVYNSLGKEVAELVNEVKGAGRYNATFNASKLSSGIYFYTIQVNDFVQTNKMLLVK